MQFGSALQNLNQGWLSLKASRLYLPVMSLLFILTWFAAYQALDPINYNDWIRTAQFLRYAVQLDNPYTSLEIMPAADLAAYDIPYGWIPYSPWFVFYMGIFAYASIKAIIALNVALWTVVVLDSGKLPALVLVLHPIFIMLWASSNVDLILTLSGVWLIYKGVRGWRWGVAVMLIAIKPQVLPLLILLETGRMFYLRDWRALLTMALMAGAGLLLYPRWLDWPLGIVGDLLDSFGGDRGVTEAGSDFIEYRFSYSPLSVGLGFAIVVTLGTLALMRKRLDEWRTLAILIGYIWSPYIMPYSYNGLLFFMRKETWWRVGLFMLLSLATLPIFFREPNKLEPYGIGVFILLTALLSSCDKANAEGALRPKSV